ncbi:MAG: hypothetical protein EP343_31235 [Deltaproteobacteria bacterium]|nr:MAG: hypothetical protein EP343_31235 [Deltaproteobacteria bacterium]
MSFRWELIQNPNFLFAAKASKVILAIVVAIGLLGIVYWMLRSLGIDRNTPPSMILRKLYGFLRSFYRPFLSGGKWKKAAKWEEKKKYDAAVDIYLDLFDFDGLTSSRASIAIHNDRCLEHLEDVCKVVGYPFPNDRINRLREDIYDFFLVKQKYLSPTDYDGTELTRPENEQRFSDKLNFSQEQALVDGFRNFMQSFTAKLKKHIISGAPPIVTPEDSAVSVSNVNMDSVVNPFEAGGNPAPAVFEPPADPFGSSPPVEAEIPLPEPPGIFGQAQQDAPLPAPPDPFGAPPAGQQPASLGAPPMPPSEPNPFSIDDPRVPHHEATGRIHKLPGEHDDFVQDSPAESTQIAPMPTPGGPGMAGGPGFPQPTGGFPGFGGAPATPNPPMTPAFPQPTGGFPGLGAGPATPPPGVAPSAPQPTGGFPGFAGTPGTPIPGSQPPGTPGFPQPTGGFPGFAGAPATPNPAATPAFPQPTGGFPGFAAGPNTPTPGSQPPGAPGFPQPTGGFPGFAAGPATPPPNPGSQPPGAPGFPQPTGGFPGFGGAPSTPPPFPPSDEDNK